VREKRPLTRVTLAPPALGRPPFSSHPIPRTSTTAYRPPAVADLIGADPKEIVFTSGATEANNMAVKGVARFYRDKKRHVITTTTEHKCVLDSCRALEADGWTVTYLPVGSNGLIDLAQLEAAITPSTALVSVMGVNNEIGVIQPLAEIGAICRRRKVFFHTDAAQVCEAVAGGGGGPSGGRGSVPAGAAAGVTRHPLTSLLSPLPSTLPLPTLTQRWSARCRSTWTPPTST
jgi:hypothetical protein